ncbi:MAG: ABC transporter ATP-binding protein [Firmicutes bacterium]|nr:ABC transporter ATP-binding protein [Bacillota bacterium]
MEIIRAEGIHVSYREKKVISGLNVGINKGAVVSIIGPNGSGKTTFLKVLSRNIRPDKGRVLLNGRDISSIAIKKLARQMAVLTQTHHCPQDVTVRQLVAYGRFAYKEWWSGMSLEDEEIVEWAMETTAVRDFSRRRAGTLSGGEMQRVWLAMAIAQKPQVLLLDEPTTYLDICHQLEILELVQSLNRSEGITVIMVLHDINQAARYSDELLVLKEGCIYTRGAPERVMNADVLREVFRVEASVGTDSHSGSPVFYPRKVV